MIFAYIGLCSNCQIHVIYFEFITPNLGSKSNFQYEKLAKANAERLLASLFKGNSASTKLLKFDFFASWVFYTYGKIFQTLWGTENITVLKSEGALIDLEGKICFHMKRWTEHLNHKTLIPAFTKFLVGSVKVFFSFLFLFLFIYLFVN